MTKITKAVFVAACLLSTVLAAAAQDDLDGWLAGRTLEKTMALRPTTPPAADTPAGLDLVERAESVARRTHEIHTLLGPQHISRLARKRLSDIGLGPARRFGSTVDKAIIPVDTLRVLIVRIDFETDRSGDLTSVTTDGGFLLEPDPDIMFDAPPHDRDYYMAHLAGLSEYYKVQSGGKLRIEGRVLPAGDNDAYSLSDIADYGPGAGAGWTLPMLETLVQDMIVAADEGTQADGDVSLADFDDDDPLTYVVFVHAGADWQSDVAMDSPNDIPTFFVTLGESVPLASIDSSTGMPGSLTECSIIPETTSQDGLSGGIAGALYHEFGHALGLPDVYDTSTGLPAVGYWDLMDSGPNLIASIGIDDDGDDVADRVENVLGILPPSLSAWCRWYLGWLRVDELTGDEREIHLPAVQVELDDYRTWYRDYDFNPGYPQAIIAGSSPREFFLLENRWVPFSSAELPDEGGIGFVRDPDTGVLLYMGGDAETPGGSNWRNTGMYDFFLPAGGLLAWHVDQDRIDRGLVDNTINNEGKGLRLLEADGIQDVGVYAAYVLGFTGWNTDPFYAAVDTLPGTSDRISSDGRPSSAAWDLSRTGVEIHDISGPFATMTFLGKVSPLHEGSPWSLPSFDNLADTVTPRELDSATMTPWIMNGEPVVLAASRGAEEGEGVDAWPWLFAWKTNGEILVTPPVGAPNGAVWGSGSALAGPPVVAATAVPGEEQLLVATLDGIVRALPSATVGSDLVPNWVAAVGDTLLSPPVPLMKESGTLLACNTGPNTFRFVDSAGLATTVLVHAGSNGEPFLDDPRAVVLDDGRPGIFVAVADQWFVISENDHLLWGDWPAGAFAEDEAVATAFIPDAAGNTVALVTGSGVMRVALDGATDAAWADPGLVEGAPMGEPAVADLDGDGRNDLIVLSASHIHALSADLLPLTGWPVRILNTFPLASSVSLDGGLAVFDGDGDGVNEVWVTTDGGHLMSFDASGDLSDRTPFLWGSVGGAGLAVGDAGDVGRVLWLAEPGGRSSVGLGKTNVTGRLSAYLPPAETTAGGTSEWLGRAGGVHRSGTTGTPAVVDGAPAAADRDLVIVYPNPVGDEPVRFRFWAGAEGTARVTVFTIEGEIVDQVAADVVPGAVNELIWTPQAVASGVYMCRYEIPDASGPRVEVRQLAVER